MSEVAKLKSSGSYLWALEKFILTWESVHTGQTTIVLHAQNLATNMTAASACRARIGAYALHRHPPSLPLYHSLGLVVKIDLVDQIALDALPPGF